MSSIGMGIADQIGNLTSEVYEKVLMDQVLKGEIPMHIGIITDGNRRYARGIGISENEGHIRGKEKLEEVLQWCMDVGVRVVTVYGFSTENFRREKKEVEFLFRLINDAFLDLLEDKRIYENKIRVKVIGEFDVLPDFLRETIGKVEESTKGFKNFSFNIALGYGGRAEIITAIKKMYSEIEEGKFSIEDVTEEKFREYLYDRNLPDPDLILRTSGEERISNFLLWQSAYSELYFSDVNWPDLKKTDFLKAILSFQSRKRRFGV